MTGKANAVQVLERGVHMATKNKATSKQVASDAGKALANPRSSQVTKEMSASALSQSKKSRSKK